MTASSRRAIIFDLDGTLADTMNDIHASVNAALGQLGYPARSRAEVLSFINHGAINLIQLSMPSAVRSDEKALAECYDIYNKIYMEHYFDTTALFDGIAAAVRSLKEAGIPMAVLSNKQHAQTCGIIEKLFEPGTFRAVIGHSKFPHKPDKTAPLYIAELFGAAPSETVFAGDSDTDMQTAVNAGMYPLGVSWGYRPSDVLRAAGAVSVIDRPSQLISFMGI